MNILNFFRGPRQATASQAKERLQILLSHERADLAGPEYLPRLKNELMEVIAKYVSVDNDKIAVNLANSGNMSVLEVNIELPKSMTGERIAS